MRMIQSSIKNWPIECIKVTNLYLVHGVSKTQSFFPVSITDAERLHDNILAV